MTSERLRAWAERIGPATLSFIENVIATRAHPQQAYRSCLGTLRLAKRYGDDRLEAACGRASALRSFTFKSVEAILKHRLDQQPLEPTPAAAMPKLQHANVRGGTYYARGAATRHDDDARNPAC